MNHTKTNVTGYILAGGQSSRMGMDKGLIELNNKAIIEHVIHQLKPVVNNIVIVSGNQAYSKFGYELITDIIPQSGPAGGIHAALNHTATASNFILSCDMPFVTSQAIDFVINHAQGFQITIPFFKNNYEPMFGVYSKDCASYWQTMMKEGKKKLLDLISQFAVQQLFVDGNSLFDDSVFININTKEDLMNAMKR